VQSQIASFVVVSSLAKPEQRIALTVQSVDYRNISILSVSIAYSRPYAGSYYP